MGVPAWHIRLSVQLLVLAQVVGSSPESGSTLSVESVWDSLSLLLCCPIPSLSLSLLKISSIYSWETHRERGRDTGRGRSRLHAGILMWDLIPGLQDHALGQRQVLNCWATQGFPLMAILKPLLLIPPFLSFLYLFLLTGFFLGFGSHFHVIFHITRKFWLYAGCHSMIICILSFSLLEELGFILAESVFTCGLRRSGLDLGT